LDLKFIVDFETTVPEKRRGPTLMTDIWNQPIEKRIVVRWNKYWQPVGDEASMLANFLGTIARNPRLCCLKYSDWRKVPKKDKERLLDIVKVFHYLSIISKKSHIMLCLLFLTLLYSRQNSSSVIRSKKNIYCNHWEGSGVISREN
jgi:hypothetical protein